MLNSAAAWEIHCSVDVDVPVSFAWQYMTDVRNWSDPPAEFGLEGPFASGSLGWTRMPGQPARSWMLRDVEPERAYTIGGGSFLEGAVLLVRWRFDPLSERQHETHPADGIVRRERRSLCQRSQGGIRTKPRAGDAEDREDDGASCGRGWTLRDCEYVRDLTQ